MKNKMKTSLIIVLTIMIIMIVALTIFLSRKDNSNREPDNAENISENKLVKIIKRLDNFKDADFKFDEKTGTFSIDDTYIITIKNGYYMINIKDKKLENTYCQIVDAIETDLGHSPGKSIETCEKTLDGAIALGGISAEIYDSYKVLTVNSETPATLYDIETSRQEGEIISKDEINYNILVDNYLFTSMSTSYTESTKDFAICGHAYHEKNKNRDFLIKIYDENKNEISEKTFSYKNDKKKYLSFCVNYELQTDSASYFSIEVQK